MHSQEQQPTQERRPFHRRLLAELGAAAPSIRPSPTSTVGAAAPPNWPSDIPVALVDYVNWCEQIEADNVWEATPASDQDVVTIINWAAANGFTVRAVGKSHNWSPLVLPAGAGQSSTVLVSTENLSGCSFQGGAMPTVTLGAGVTIDDATSFLEAQGDNGVTTAPGYTFLNFTAPGDLTIGGVLAVGGHGTGIPIASEPDLDGCLSNLVVSLTAAVADPANPGQYALQSFARGNEDTAAFLVHLGRAFVTEVTLSVVPNYYLQATNWYPDTATLFEAPSSTPSPQSLSQLLQTFGRVEVIWFPFTDHPWVKTWQRMDSEVSPQVPGPYNYPWSCDICPEESRLIADGLHLWPALTPYFLAGDLLIAMIKAPASDQLNGTARDLLLYVKPTTALYSMMGYAVQMPLGQVQGAANAFFTQFESLVEQYASDGRYPANGPVEIRFTSVDRVAALGVSDALPPALSVTNPICGQGSDDVVFWVDSLTFPGTSAVGEFYETLEGWLRNDWGPQFGTVVRPEWSKGWAYSASGPWTNVGTIAQLPCAYPDWSSAKSTLQKYDPAGLYTNPFLSQLL
jgi:hypothetical protein